MPANSRVLASTLLLVACGGEADAGPAMHDTSSGEVASSGTDGGADGSSSSIGGSEGSGLDEPPIAQGRELWRRSLGPGRASAVAVVPGGGAVVVGVDDPFGGRAWAIGVDERGTVQWQHMLEQPDGHAEYTDVAVGADGEVWVVGWRAASILGPAFSIVLERLDAASGHVVWSDPGQDVTAQSFTGADLHAVIALADGVLVAGQRMDEATAEERPTLWRYDRDGVLQWETSWPEQGRADDLVLVDDVVVLVGSTFGGHDPADPRGVWAGIAKLDGEHGPQLVLPPGPADLRLAIATAEGEVLAIGSSEGEDEHGFDREYGGMLSITTTGRVGAAVELPAGIRGAAFSGTALIVADDDGTVRGLTQTGEPSWELDDTVAVGLTHADALALAEDGNVLVAGGYDMMELAKIAAPE